MTRYSTGLYRIGMLPVNRRHLLKLGAAGAGVLATPFLLRSGALAQEVMELRIGTDGTGESPGGVAVKAFADQLNAKNVGLKATVYNNASLGGEREMAESVRLGTLDASVASAGNIASFSPKFSIFDLPYVFSDANGANCAMDGGVGKVLAAEVNDKLRAKVLCSWSYGTRDVWNSKHPIGKPDDFHGLKLRVQQSAVQVATLNALGAQAVPISFGELYTSLQTGVVDGADNGVGDVLTEKFYEVTKYFSMTEHFTAMVMMLLSNSTWDKLSQEQKDAITEVAAASQKVGRDRQVELEAFALGEVKKFGIIFNDIPDKTAFKELVKPIYDKFVDKIGQDLLDLAQKSSC